MTANLILPSEDSSNFTMAYWSSFHPCYLLSQRHATLALKVEMPFQTFVCKRADKVERDEKKGTKKLELCHIRVWLKVMNAKRGRTEFIISERYSGFGGLGLSKFLQIKIDSRTSLKSLYDHLCWGFDRLSMIVAILEQSSLSIPFQISRNNRGLFHYWRVLSTRAKRAISRPRFRNIIRCSAASPFVFPWDYIPRGIHLHTPRLLLGEPAAGQRIQ